MRSVWFPVLAVLILLAALFVVVEQADAHPGGTDGNGCHVCSTNCTERWSIPYGFYHRHNPVRACFASTAPQPAQSPAPSGGASAPEPSAPSTSPRSQAAAEEN